MQGAATALLPAPPERARNAMGHALPMSSEKTSADLRQAFLGFFRDKGHEIVPSGPLIPPNEIGRASCRERVSMSVGGGAATKKKKGEGRRVRKSRRAHRA